MLEFYDLEPDSQSNLTYRSMDRLGIVRQKPRSLTLYVLFLDLLLNLNYLDSSE